MICPQTIKSYIKPNSTLIVGFSGGPDSVCLLILLAKLQQQLNLTIIAAHLDHQWRPQSQQDSLWCKQFCDNLAVPCVIKTPADLNISIKYNGSKEELGRKLRRTFFQDLAQEYKADTIVLAHHADDQLETFFIRLIRGSCLTGLTGMQQHDGIYLRPLLHISKQEILNYLHHHNIAYLTDATNVDPKYLRNRIRHQLMPQLMHVDERFTKNLASCMHHLQKTNDFLESLCQQTWQNIRKNQDSVDIKINEFLQLHEIMQHRILLKMLIEQNISFTPSSSLFVEIIRFLKKSDKKIHQITQTCSIIKHDQYFSFKSL